MVPNLFKAVGILGHFTNHLLRVTSATRLFEAHVDEQLIMERTGHSMASMTVRAYINGSENNLLQMLLIVFLQ